MYFEVFFRFISQQEPAVSSVLKMNRIFTKDSKINRIFTKDVNRKIDSSSVHSMSKAVANAESSPAGKQHELMKSASNESNRYNLFY